MILNLTTASVTYDVTYISYGKISTYVHVRYWFYANRYVLARSVDVINTWIVTIHQYDTVLHFVFDADK